MEGVRKALREHAKQLGLLAGDYAVRVHPFLAGGRRERGETDCEGLSALLADHARHLRKLASLAEKQSQVAASHARALRRGQDRKTRKTKADRSSVPDHIVSDAPCDQKDREYFEEILKQQSETVSEFWKQRYESEAGKFWDMFYKRNENRFFKDRHYLQRMLETDINEANDNCNDGKLGPKLLEVGCGVGNTIFPLLQDNPRLIVYGVDVSKNAISIIKTRPELQKYEDRCKVWVCNVVEESFPDDIGRINLATLIFVLSAIHPKKIGTVLKKVYSQLLPEGKLIIRDYARYDLSQLRFGPGSKLDENFYVRQDGTRTYFFTKETLREFVEDAGFEIINIEYHRKTVKNVKKGIEMKRTWLFCRCKRPVPSHHNVHVHGIKHN